MVYLFYIFVFIFGSAIGSFLNAAIYRLGTGEDIVKKRSRCPSCGKVLAWYDLIPIASFFILRGRCRNCEEKISWQYPLVETAAGLLFMAIFNEFSSSDFQIMDLMNLGYWLFIVSCCIVIFVYDSRHYIIPDLILLPAVIGTLFWRGFLSLLAPSGVEGVIGHFWPYLFSAMGAAAFFLFLLLATRGQGMGMGDAKLAFLMGLILGWPKILLALFLAFFIGAFAGIALIISGRKTMKSRIPFGPFLIIGTIAAIFWGESLIGLVFFIGG